MRNVPEPEVKSVDNDDEDENELEEVEATIDAKASDDFDLYDFMKEDVRAVGNTQEPEDGEVEDV